MQSDLIDGFLGSYLEIPARLTWDGGAADLVRGVFQDARLELGGIATRWLNLERVVVRGAQVNFVPGAPARFRVAEPRVEISLGQAEIDRWLNRSELPFRLELGDAGLIVHASLAGLSVGEFETRLRVSRGWFVLEPRRASVLGVPGYVPSLLRSYLPLPPLTDETRVASIEHTPGRITLTLEIDDFEERVTPGLLGRVRRRVLPFGGG